MAYNASNETQEELAVIQKNQRGDYLVVKKVTSNVSGSVSADVRNYYTTGEGTVMPTSKGVRVNSELLLDVMVAMAKCLEVNEIEDLKDKLDELLDESEVDDSDVPEE